MSSRETGNVSRRELIVGGLTLIVSFSSLRPGMLRAEQALAVKRPGSLADEPMLDSWIRIDAGGNVTVFTGKAELGQGVKTALIQVAAEELAVPADRVTLMTADTQRTPDEGYTAGSHSMQNSGTAIMHAAAQVREILLSAAAKKWSIEPGRLKAADGLIVSGDGRHIRYGELVNDAALHVEAQPQSKLTSAANYRLIGESLPRIDIPAKVTGGVAYVHDLRLPGMVHARVVRPPSYSAKLREVKLDAVDRMPGVVKTVRDGSYLAVVAQKEYQAIMAMHALEAAAVWDETAALPEQRELFAYLAKQTSETTTIFERQGLPVSSQQQLEASYRRSYQIHGSIGPSCSVAVFDAGTMTVWTHSQGVYPLRAAIAKMLALPEDKVRCIHLEGAGCYGHNGADDAAADAALIARSLPGKAVRVQWTREQEHTWEPYGTAMTTKVRASLDAAGNISSWQFAVWSSTHSMRPSRAGNLMPSWHLESPQPRPAPRALPQPDGGGDRNAIPLYEFPNTRVAHHFIPAMPLRVSAMRSLGAFMNIFSIESFMDELASLAHVDPVAFRLRHLKDVRARDVINLAATRFGWDKRPRAQGQGSARGCGFAFARYKNSGSYAAIAVEVSVEKESGEIVLQRAVAAVDAGQAINPDGIRNQIEGGILQSSSWTLFEMVTFDTTRITSRNWSSYPIMRFSSVPRSVQVHLVERPGQPFLGTGEAAQGPTSAAIANAVAAATGRRIRELPLMPRALPA